MLRARISKSIGLIGLVATFLLCTAQSFEPTPKLYRAKPEDLPTWAEQGNFRFIRLDGGQIESWKAERTWWGSKFSSEEKDVLSHIYDRDFEEMLGLLKQAEFNWIWVTWSSGWSLKDESENRENLKKVIARCHENGIRVSAYLSAANMFRKSAYRDDPETRNYGLWMHGVPMFYAGPTKTDLKVSWGRRLADARKPAWRAYLLKKAELAVDAGVDAIMWDNMIGYDDGLAQLLDDAQRMAERKARETGRPKVMVEANIHIAPNRFAMNGMNEVIWEEDGKDTPGVWNGHWQVGNARKIKFLNGEKQLWQPLKYENDLYHCGRVRQKTTSNYTAVIMNPRQAFEILLNIPEPRRTLVLTDAATALRVSEILGLMWMDLDFVDQVIEVKRAYVWAQFKVPKSKASKAPVPMHPVLAGFLMAWRERTSYAKDDDYVFPSVRLKGKKPLSASIMVQKYLRPAAIKAGVIKEGELVRFGFHNFRHSLASSLVKLKCDPKTVQGILRHEDVRTTMQLYAQSDKESRLEAQGKFLALLLGDKAHLLTETIQ